MIYLYRHADPHAIIAAAECERRAAALEQRGFVRCSKALHRVLWQQRDRAAFRELLSAITPPTQCAPLAPTLPRGWKRYTV